MHLLILSCADVYTISLVNLVSYKVVYDDDLTLKRLTCRHSSGAPGNLVAATLGPCAKNPGTKNFFL